tara:strand:+ start:186 stop:491 length:306 start_codon:yes stop_codon:yes gene_type:complete
MPSISITSRPRANRSIDTTFAPDTEGKLTHGPNTDQYSKYGTQSDRELQRETSVAREGVDHDYRTGYKKNQEDGNGKDSSGNGPEAAERLACCLKWRWYLP